MAKNMDQLRRDKLQMQETITDLQFRSMKMNSVFSGLGGERKNENTQEKLRQFLYNELEVTHHVEFSNVHRFGRFTKGKPRPIVARFLYQEDLEMVLERSSWLRGTSFGVHRQYPVTMEKRRRELIPIMRQLRSEGAHVKLVRDKLIVNGRQYDPDNHSYMYAEEEDWDTNDPMDYDMNANNNQSHAPSQGTARGFR
ncbi:uncharacterized protein LOC134278754 [Saccostrea cucullata]|uniref:uncharacterized protein LOC134278754 n=1 Tax=Saccostrea cuccullata TaxID=36930 RepID=UPI002ED3E779